MFPSLVRAEMASKTVNANIELKSQVIEGPSVEGKVIAGASQFITEFDGAALLDSGSRHKGMGWNDRHAAWGAAGTVHQCGRHDGIGQ